MICIMIVFITLLVTSVLRGSKKSESIIGIPVCGWADWCLYAAFHVISLSVLVFSVIYLKKLNKKKSVVGYKFMKGDIKWTYC
jgi:hypothetical protein